MREAASSVESDVLLEARDIAKSFPGVRALDGVRLTVRRGPPFEAQATEHTLRVTVIERPAAAAATS